MSGCFCGMMSCSCLLRRLAGMLTLELWRGCFHMYSNSHPISFYCRRCLHCRRCFYSASNAQCPRVLQQRWKAKSCGKGNGTPQCARVDHKSCGKGKGNGTPPQVKSEIRPIGVDLRKGSFILCFTALSCYANAMQCNEDGRPTYIRGTPSCELLITWHHVSCTVKHT